jgi:aspartate racemase
MKTIGMVGGIAPESTIDYYRTLLSTAQERGVAEAPSILIDSLDVKRLLALATADDRDGLAAYLLQSVAALARGGAGVAFIAANTPHLVFDAVEAGAPIPLVSIVTATCAEAERRGLKRLALIGTRFTMQGGFYQAAFASRGLEIVLPAGDDLAYVHDKYVGELVRAIFNADTRTGYLDVLRRLRADAAIDGVILGGTELPLLLRGVDYPLPMLDTTRIHVNAVLDAAATL